MNIEGDLGDGRLLTIQVCLTLLCSLISPCYSSMDPLKVLLMLCTVQTVISFTG